MHNAGAETRPVSPEPSCKDGSGAFVKSYRHVIDGMTLPFWLSPFWEESPVLFQKEKDALHKEDNGDLGEPLEPINGINQALPSLFKELDHIFSPSLQMGNIFQKKPGALLTPISHEKRCSRKSSAATNAQDIPWIFSAAFFEKNDFSRKGSGICLNEHKGQQRIRQILTPPPGR